MGTEVARRKPFSFFRALLSLMVPGLGQAVAGAYSRGLFAFLGVVVMGGLTVYTAAQRPRYPDYGFSFKTTLVFLGETAALWIFLLALFSLARRYVLRDEFVRTFSGVLFALLGVVAFGGSVGPMLSMTIPADMVRQIYGFTALAGAAVTSAIWLWAIFDAGGLDPQEPGPVTPFLLLIIVGVLILGSRLTQIDLPKAIREYRDTEKVLSSIFWPWQAAFDYEASALEATAKLEAPCVDEQAAPPVNQPKEGEPWIVVTPTCGELSTRDTKGHLTYGTLLTIKGGGFKPGLTVKLEWEDPIGNRFTPRGVGDTEIPVGDEGTFTTQLYMPSLVIPSVAQGVQIHTLHAIQRGALKFTGRLSKEMKLALQAMLETIMMGLMATFTGIVLSVPISFLAARNLMSSIYTSAQGFVGGVVGLVVGGWAGKVLADLASAPFGGLEGAPVLTATLHFLFILGFAILAFRLMARALDALAAKAPLLVAQGVTIVGMVLIGAVVGYVLGVLYAKGVLSITRGADQAAQAASRFGWGGAAVFGFLGAWWAVRMGKADKVPIGAFIYTVTRLTLNIVRSIEPLIWAVMGVIWVGPGPFAGFIALSLHSVAALGKLYSEAIESINPGPIEALQATGANRLQTIMYAVVPQVLPPFTSFTLYRWDINVRMSTVIGLVGGGGIGFLLIQWIRQFQYHQAGIAVWLITITVAALDFISASIRERMV